jgi:hypothetical protein
MSRGQVPRVGTSRVAISETCRTYELRGRFDLARAETVEATGVRHEVDLAADPGRSGLACLPFRARLCYDSASRPRHHMSFEGVLRNADNVE